MRTSQTGLQLIQHYEGCLLHAYQDSGGIHTIGYGHTPSHSGETITQEEADGLLATDVVAAENAIHDLVHVELAQHEFDALASWTFNLGRGHLLESTLLAKLNAGDRVGAAAEFVRWDRNGGLVVKGLLDRRSAEAHLFRTGQLVFF